MRTLRLVALPAVATLGLAFAPSGPAGAATSPGGTGGAKGHGTHQFVTGPLTEPLTTCAGVEVTVTYDVHITFKSSGPATTSVSSKTSIRQIGTATGTNGDDYSYSAASMYKAVHFTTPFTPVTPTTGKGSSATTRSTASLTDLTTGEVTSFTLIEHMTFDAHGTLVSQTFTITTSCAG